MPPCKTSLSHVTNVFIDSWVVFYGIPAYVLTDNEVQFTSKLLAMLLTMLCVKHLTTIVYYSQTNGLVEWDRRTVSTSLMHYNATIQDCDPYVQPLTYAHNEQVHKFANSTTFSLALSQHSPEPKPTF